MLRLVMLIMISDCNALLTVLMLIMISDCNAVNCPKRSSWVLKLVKMISDCKCNVYKHHISVQNMVLSVNNDI